MLFALTEIDLGPEAVIDVALVLATNAEAAPKELTRNLGIQPEVVFSLHLDLVALDPGGHGCVISIPPCWLTFEEQQVGR